MNSFKTVLSAFAVFIVILIIAAGVFIKTTIYHPDPVESIEVVSILNAETQAIGPSLKILCYNVQYFAGKDYVFFYDLPGFSGPDTRPSSKSIKKTLDEVAAIILKQNPDIVLLQEVDEGAMRTDNENQTDRLIDRLSGKYGYFAEAFYWKAKYIPHPKINGSVGMKLTTLSKAPILSATRFQLPRIKENFIISNFNFCRAILEIRLILETGEEISVLNTHLDAFPDSPETMRQQVAYVMQTLEKLEQEGIPWIIGGDFNLLPPGFFKTMDSSVEINYSKTSELSPMFERYHSIPNEEAISGPDRNNWFTHFPNNPAVNKPDRIIDYFFYSDQFQAENPQVIQGKTWTISDHMPLVSEFNLVRE